MAARVGKYLLFETLGEGAFGKVKLGVHEDTGEQVAVKCMDKADIKAQEMTMNVRREIAIMKALKHKNIVNMVQVLSSSTKLYIVMELVTGGELFTKILNEGKLDEDLARRYFQNVVDGVDYCHARGVCHRDLKPENLLIDEASGELKITDFGLSAMRGTSTAEELELLHTQCGSPNYCAPEIIHSAKKGYNGVMVDVWSCGIILFALLAGYLPFYDENTRNLYKMIQNDAVKYPKKFPPGAKDLCERLLTKSPDRRISLAEVKQHPWFLINYTGDGVLKGTLEKIAPPTDRKQLKAAAAASEKESGGKDEEEEDEDDKEERLRKEMFVMSISKRQVAEQQPKEQPKAAPAPAKKKEHPLTSRMRKDVERYMQLFDIDANGTLVRAPSFKNSRLAPGSVNRGKSIAAATYMIIRQQLENQDEGGEIDQNEINEGTLKTFENLLQFFVDKKKSLPDTKEWYTKIALTDDESDVLEGMCQMLEPNNAEGDLEEVGTKHDAEQPKVSDAAADRGVNGAHPAGKATTAGASVVTAPASTGAAAARRSTGIARILGIGSPEFETELPVDKALREVGKILVLQGHQVMMKRGDNTKMKCEVNLGAGEKMIISVHAVQSGAKTRVSMKKASGGGTNKVVEDFFDEVLAKFNEVHR